MFVNILAAFVLLYKSLKVMEKTRMRAAKHGFIVMKIRCYSRDFDLNRQGKSFCQGRRQLCLYDFFLCFLYIIFQPEKADFFCL